MENVRKPTHHVNTEAYTTKLQLAAPLFVSNANLPIIDLKEANL